MAVTYSWGIRRVERAPNFTDPATLIAYQDVVQVVHWICAATDGANTVRGFGSVPIAWDRSTAFTPFASLTKALVAGWVQDNLNAGRQTVASIRQSLALQLADKASPPTVGADTPAWN